MRFHFQRFGVIGAGAWGTALAATLSRAGRDVVLWAKEPDVADAINTRHENAIYLKDVSLDGMSLTATNALDDIAACDALLLVVPAQHTRAMARRLAGVLGANGASSPPPLIIASKGIEQGSAALLGDVVREELPRHSVAVLTGPSFADEVARDLPAALALAVADKALGDALAVAMATPFFRPYLTEDVTGALVGGAIKNVLAVACGIVIGRHLGENARAALITRGLAEMMRLGAALGAKPETLMGLSGLGDLVLTCSSVRSRNTSLGIELGQGKSLAAILAARAAVTEGVHTAAAARALAHKHGVDMPIVEAVDAVLNRKADIDTTIAGLLARPLRGE